MKQKTCIIFINLKPSHILTYFDVNLLLLVLAELQKTANFVTHLQIAINQDFEEVSKERGSGKDTAACFLQHRNTFIVGAVLHCATKYLSIQRET